MNVEAETMIARFVLGEDFFQAWS